MHKPGGIHLKKPMSAPGSILEERILILAPSGGDALNVAAVLNSAAISSRVCSDVADLCAHFREGAAAILIAEESLRKPALSLLLDAIDSQPSWSDIPLILITSGGDTTQASIRAFEAFGPTANLTLIERPFRAITLVSTVRTAFRSRHRQYHLREVLERLEQKVKERTRELEQTVSELEAFSYSVSHDLRAPLRAMQGYTHVLIEDYSSGLNKTGKDLLERIRAASERLDRLTQDILAYSRYSRDKVECRPIDLEPLFDQILREYPAFYPPQARIEIQKPLLQVVGHEPSITQCISNLLGNAIKFVQPGKTPEIKIWTEHIDSQVRILFRDNGIGVPAEYHGRIFKMFERLVPQDRYEGTGIGLAIVAKAVERMCGKVGLESVPGGGSTFWIQLPAAK